MKQDHLALSLVHRIVVHGTNPLVCLITVCLPFADRVDEVDASTGYSFPSSRYMIRICP